jgi:ubiquinone/menaquinone biosynthesis C-methylase UbiE
MKKPNKSNKDTNLPAAELYEKEVKKYYTDVERYDWVTDTKYPEKLFHIWREREIIKWVSKYSKGATILDVGCGTGLISRHLSSNRIIALDINRWAVEKAKLHSPGRVQCVVGDAECLPLASNTFDMVICTDVLEHLLYPDKALKEILRVMKSGAFLVGEVPGKHLVWQLRQYLTTTCPVSEPFHNNYSTNEFRLMLGDFKIIKICRRILGLEVVFVAQKPPLRRADR